MTRASARCTAAASVGPLTETCRIWLVTGSDRDRGEEGVRAQAQPEVGDHARGDGAGLEQAHVGGHGRGVARGGVDEQESSPWRPRPEGGRGGGPGPPGPLPSASDTHIRQPRRSAPSSTFHVVSRGRGVPATSGSVASSSMRHLVSITDGSRSGRWTRPAGRAPVPAGLRVATSTTGVAGVGALRASRGTRRPVVRSSASGSADDDTLDEVARGVRGHHHRREPAMPWRAQRSRRAGRGHRRRPWDPVGGGRCRGRRGGREVGLDGLVGPGGDGEPAAWRTLLGGASTRPTGPSRTRGTGHRPARCRCPSMRRRRRAAARWRGRRGRRRGRSPPRSG